MPLFFLTLTVLAWSAAGCVTAVDLPRASLGGVDNPIGCPGPEGQRNYLQRLRTPAGERVDWAYLDATLGPEDRVLDRFEAENPAPDERGAWTKLTDLFRSQPRRPRYYRLYMDMYADDCEDRAPPGYELR